MNTLLELTTYSLIGKAFLGGFLAIFFTGSIFCIYSLLRYYPHYSLWIRKKLLDKPYYFIQENYIKPVKALPTHSIPTRTHHFILGGVIASSIAMVLLTYGVLSKGTITRWNIPIQQAMPAFRSSDLSAFWLKISLLNSFTMFILWALVSLYFIAKKDTWRTIHWIALGAFVGSITAGLKYGTAIPRPGSAFPIFDAFPSAHVTTHMTLLGGLLILADLHQGVKFWKRFLVYAIYGIWIYLMAFSRLYFAAHWLTDLIGGVLVSLIGLGLLSLSYYRKIPPPFIHRELRLVSALSLIGIWLMRFVLEYDRILRFYIASF